MVVAKLQLNILGGIYGYFYVQRVGSSVQAATG